MAKSKSTKAKKKSQPVSPEVIAETQPTPVDESSSPNSESVLTGATSSVTTDSSATDVVATEPAADSALPGTQTPPEVATTPEVQTANELTNDSANGAPEVQVAPELAPVADELVVDTSGQLDPRDLLKAEGFQHTSLRDGACNRFQHTSLRDGAGYQVFEKHSYGGMLIETVMIRGDFKSVKDITEIFPNGVRSPAG